MSTVSLHTVHSVNVHTCTVYLAAVLKNEVGLHEVLAHVHNVLYLRLGLLSTCNYTSELYKEIFAKVHT